MMDILEEKFDHLVFLLMELKKTNVQQHDQVVHMLSSTGSPGVTKRSADLLASSDSPSSFMNEKVAQGGSGEHAIQMPSSGTSHPDESPTFNRNHFDGIYYEDLPSLQASPLQYVPGEKNERLSLTIPEGDTSKPRTRSSLHEGGHQIHQPKPFLRKSKTHDLGKSSSPGLRMMAGNADTESWVQSLREHKERKGHRQSRLSFKSGTSGADEVKSLHSGQKATVQDMEAAFLHCVVGASGRKQSVMGPVPQEPEPPSGPSSPMQILPSQLGVPSVSRPLSRHGNSSPVMEARGTLQRGSGTSDSQTNENLMKLSNRAQTAILSQMEPGDFLTRNAICQDRGCDISLRIPHLLLGFLVLLSIVNVSLYVAFRLSFKDVDWDGMSVTANGMFTCCAVLSCIFLRDALRSTDLELTMAKLYTFVDDGSHEWDRSSRLEQWRSFAFWCLWVAVFLAGQVIREWQLEEVMDSKVAQESRAARYTLRGITAFCWSISSFLVVLEAYVQNHLLLGLDCSLDCWCAYLLDCPDFSLGVDSWNCLQALLKCISRKVAKSFLVMQISGGIACIYCLASAVMVAFLSGFALKVILVEGAFLFPVLMLFFLEMRVFWHGTNISEKCRIIPAFVNQIPAGLRINMERSYLVQFITDSSAGFFVREVKLTREMLLKNFMVVGGILSGLVAIMSRV